MPRFVKQLLYGIFFIAIFSGLAYGVYFLAKPAASCFDGVQNQNEEGVDCGGVCQRVCLPTGFRPIEPLGVTAFLPTPTTVSLLAKIQNPNSEVAARDFSYRFEIYDRAGNVTKTIRGRSFVYAREVKNLAEFAEATVAEAKLFIEEISWVKSGEFRKPELAVQEQRLTSGATELRVSGRILNNDTVTLPNVIVLVIFYGRGGAEVGVSKTELQNLSAGESRAFTVVHPLIAGVDDPKIEVLPSARR